VDGGQAVPELVRDAGRELTETRQRVLQPQLLLELDDVGEVREEADDASEAVARRGLGVPGSPAHRSRQGRHGDAEVRHRERLGHLQGASHDGAARGQ
jgi:hypothetical protein